MKQDEVKIVVTVRIPEPLVKLIDKRAENENRKRGNMIITMLKEHIERNKTWKC
jgi:metal-responsive CopG/Arc/MetJ family transcriptional regulator